MFPAHQSKMSQIPASDLKPKNNKNQSHSFAVALYGYETFQERMAADKVSWS
jgi:hypothetical protein